MARPAAALAASHRRALRWSPAVAALALALSLLGASPAGAVTCANLQTALTNAPDGGTVTLDAGLCQPPAELSVSSKTITLEGAAGGAIIDGSLFGFSRLLTLTDVGTMTIRDLTFQNSSADAGGGAAIGVSGDSSPTLNRLQFYGNAEDQGGAVWITTSGTSSDPIVVRDTIFGSTAPGGTNLATTGNGGALLIENTTRSVQITGSRFVGNSSARQGGGAHVTSDALSTLTVNSSLFSGNTAKLAGGGLRASFVTPTLIGNSFLNNAVADPSPTPGDTHEGGGAMIFLDDTTQLVTQSANVFDGNTITFGAASTSDSRGAGEAVHGGLASRGDRFRSNELQVAPPAGADSEGAGLWLEGCVPLTAVSQVLENAVVAGNRFTGAGSAAREGAGAYTGCSSGAVNLTVRNSTIAGNDGGVGGTAGLFGAPDDSLTLHNSIVAGNSGGDNLTGFSTQAVSFSDACLAANAIPAGTGNFCSDPLLVDPSPGVADVHQTAGSPTRDKGSNALVPGDLTTDFEGDGRIQGAAVDMGADEVNEAATAAGGGGGGAVVDPFAPGVTGAAFTNSTFAVGGAPTPVNGQASQRKRRKIKTGTTIRYTLSEPATVRLRIDRRLAGRRVRRKGKRVCVKPTRKNRKQRKCTRYKRAGRTLIRTSKTGKNSVKFSGRIGRKALKRGRYRLTIVAADAAGNKSKAKRLRFRIVKP